jgi:hypothetical protein
MYDSSNPLKIRLKTANPNVITANINQIVFTYEKLSLVFNQLFINERFGFAYY